MEKTSPLMKINCPNPECGQGFHIRLGITKEEQKAYADANDGDELNESRVCPFCEALVIVRYRKEGPKKKKERERSKAFGEELYTLQGNPSISAISLWRCPECDYKEEVIHYSALNPPQCPTHNCKLELVREPLESGKGVPE
ncbi:MAG: hypothetical protein ACMUIU_00355 [bacterium]